MLQLVPQDSEILRTVCQPFDFNHPPFDQHDLIVAMVATMRRHHGVGLAAPQIGIPYRIFVMGDAYHSIACFNPEIIEQSTETVRDEEGCLSFPDLYLKVERAQAITTRFCNASGAAIEQRFINLFARCFAHELDHLNGICFTEVVGPLALTMGQNRRKKLLRGKLYR